MTSTNPNCPHCGKPLTRPEAPFCTHCGAPLKDDDSAKTVHGGSLAKIIVHLPGEETQEEFLAKPTISLGRRKTNTIQILAAYVSGEHAVVKLTRQGHTITDLNSTNGTFVNGKQLTPDEPHLLANNDIIRLSDKLGNSASLTYIAPSNFVDVHTIDHLELFQLDTPISYIGRNGEAAISLNHPAVSWNHAKVIKREDDRYTIQDLSSNNGTFLNGSHLRQERVLQQGDVIQIGPFNLVYRGHGTFTPYSAERNFRLETINLERVVYPSNILGFRKKNQPIKILQDVTLVINPREFVALVGGSGTGKSTLLKAMSGVTPATSGTVLVNGDNLYDHFNLYRNMIGYVPQDDIIHRGLQVQRALYYAARLRLPDATPEEITNRVEDVLTKMGLMAQAESQIRHLSGGQRKRVSIAAELLAEPWIFFLDEPTSGLDPGLEKVMMDTLRQLADEGRTIVLVTHATNNIIDNCDQIVFLMTGGKLTYYGPSEEVMNFFEVEDFSDIYTRLSQTFTVEDIPNVPPSIKPYLKETIAKTEDKEVSAGPLWAERFRRSPFYQTFIVNRQTGEMARPKIEPARSITGHIGDQIKQFKVLSQRYFDIIRHDNISLIVLLAVMPLIALFLLLISNGAALVGHSSAQIEAFLEVDGHYTIVNEAQTILFMMALAVTLLGIFAASYEIIRETTIYQRERAINLRISPYFLSKFGILTAFILFQCLLLLVILAFRVSYPASGVLMWTPMEFYITLALTALASIALGLCISAATSSQNSVIYLVLLVLFVQIVFSGAIFKLSVITEPLSYLTITRWSLEGLGISANMNALNELGQIRIEREVDLARGSQTLVEDAATTVDFTLNYTRNVAALLARWVFLLAHTLIWSSLAIFFVKKKDEI